MRRSGHLLLAAILLAAFAVRAGWGWRQSVDRAGLASLPDQKEYLELGDHVRDHSGYWFADPRFGALKAYRTPGYPFLIAMCGSDPRMIRLAQAAIDASTVLAIYLLARIFLGQGPSLIAAGLTAVNPYLIFFSGLILTETLFTGLLCWGMFLFLRSGGPWPKGRSRTIAWLCGGILLALAALVRPGAIALPVVLGCAAAFVTRDTVGFNRTRWPIPIAATMVLLTGAVFFPWAARNRLEVYSWVWTSTNEGITRYDGFNPDATGASDQRFADRMPWLKDMTEVGRSEYLLKNADEWITSHPAASARLAIVKIARTWSPIPLSDQYGSQAKYVLVGLLYAVPFDLLLLFGLFRRGLARAAKVMLLIPAMYFTAGAALSVGSLRYRVPAEPPMAIVAASALGGIRIGRRASVAAEPVAR